MKRDHTNKSLPLDSYGDSSRPIFFLWVINFFMDKILVIIYDPLSSIWIFSTISKTSQIQWYLSSMCLDFKWMDFLKDEWYFDCYNISIYFYFRPNSHRKIFIHKSFLQTFVIAIYLITIANKIIHFYNLNCHNNVSHEKSYQIIEYKLSRIYIASHVSIYVPIQHRFVITKI